MIKFDFPVNSYFLLVLFLVFYCLLAHYMLPMSFHFKIGYTTSLQLQSRRGWFVVCAAE